MVHIFIVKKSVIRLKKNKMQLYCILYGSTQRTFLYIVENRIDCMQLKLLLIYFSPKPLSPKAPPTVPWSMRKFVHVLVWLLRNLRTDTFGQWGLSLSK